MKQFSKIILIFSLTMGVVSVGTCSIADEEVRVKCEPAQEREAIQNTLGSVPEANGVVAPNQNAVIDMALLFFPEANFSGK